MGERIIAVAGRSREAMDDFLARSAVTLATGSKRADFSRQIDAAAHDARARLAEVEASKGRDKILIEHHARDDRHNFITAMAIRQLLAEEQLLERFYTEQAYSPFRNSGNLGQHPDPSDADIWCVEITPPDASVRLNYKYSPGVNNEGWEFALLAIHRQSPLQWILPPEALDRLRLVDLVDRPA